MSFSENLAPFTCESKGRMVVPACPPITGTSVVATSKPWFSATKAFALTTEKFQYMIHFERFLNYCYLVPSNVVTPKSLRGLYTPCFFKVSAKIGTVEFTGLLIIKKNASGENFAPASANPFTMLALVLNRS